MSRNLRFSTALATLVVSKAFAKSPSVEVKFEEFVGLYEGQMISGEGIRTKLVLNDWEFSADLSALLSGKLHQAQINLTSPKWKKFSLSAYVLRSIFIPTDIGSGGTINFEQSPFFTASLGADYNLYDSYRFTTLYLNFALERGRWKFYLNPTYSPELKGAEIIAGISYSSESAELFAKCWSFFSKDESLLNCQFGIALPLYRN